MYSIADFLRDQGRQEGRQEGLRDALRALAERRFRGLTDAERARIDAADPATLMLWMETLLDAERLEDVLAAS